MFTTRFDVAFTATPNKMASGRLLPYGRRAVADATLSFLRASGDYRYSSVSSSLKSTENGALGGFEPPTARFVAEHFIQLSYGCIGKSCFTADIDTAGESRIK